MTDKSVYNDFNANQVVNRSLRGSIIVIEGLIGAGKSTLGKGLAEYLNRIGIKARFFPEFVNHDLLGLYIGDMEKYAFPFQAIMVKERLAIYQKAAEYSATGGISIIDRSLIGDLTFAKMQKDKEFFTEKEWLTYNSLLKNDDNITPSILIYLECQPQKAFDRMKKRSHESEVDGYTLGYFEDLDKAYKETLNSEEVEEILCSIDWNVDRKITDKVCTEVLTKVRNFIFRAR